MTKPKSIRRFHSEVRWIITYSGYRDQTKRAAFCGGSLTRKWAIEEHVANCYGKLPNDQFKSVEEAWNYCKNNGLNVVKGKIGWVE